jgi:6-phosphofructokinase 1
MIYDDVIANPDAFTFTPPKLGPCTIPSPVKGCTFISDEDRILVSSETHDIARWNAKGTTPPSFEKAGPRKAIFHDPAWSRAAIITCGGLCPGINDVIKGIVQLLWFDYGVRDIFGIQYGFEGLTPAFRHKPVMLDPDVVDTIHDEGGTILGSSRGRQDTATMADTLQRMRINMLFCVGGDGTLRCAHDISEELQKRHAPISVIGIPKTIDNDLHFIGRSFGFETAVYTTNEIITSAHVEARGAYNGIGLVKLMGRDSGFIAAYASMANSVVNFCLVPEVPFTMEGEHGLLKALERRFEEGKTHCVIVVAEGAGQELMKEEEEERRDKSGNLLKKDIGLFLRERIEEHFKAIDIPASMKYFDPSYQIRSVPALGTDAILCHMLAQNAVHAAMAGRTDCVIGNRHNIFSHVPIPLAATERQKLETQKALWRAVLAATRQNDYFNLHDCA